MENRKGFTLAEVLICLGIIGIIAALTIPTLLAHTQSKHFQSQFRKSLSVLCQAAMMNVAMDEIDFSSLEPEDDDEHMEHCESTKHMINIIKKRLVSPEKFKYSEIKESDLDIGKSDDSPLKNVDKSELFEETTETSYLFMPPAFADEHETNSTVTLNAFVLADGSVFAYNKFASKCKSEDNKTLCVGYIDVNGNAGPNQEITCTNGELEGKTMNANGVKCEVDETAVTDIFPVYFYGQGVVPASDAARSLLTSK